MYSKHEIIALYRFAILYGLLFVVIIGCSYFNLTTIISPSFNEFNTDNEDWHVSENAIESYCAIGGNPGGYISGTDKESGLWYFIASKSFVSEIRRSYGRTLIFDLKQSATDSQVNARDIILTDGLSTLTFDTSYHPSTTWTHYSVKLDEFSGWKKGKVKASKADMQALLQNLTDLQIRGEYRAGPDQGGLDNVAIF